MLEHGYTNETRLVDGNVVKTYTGDDGETRRAREELVISSLGDDLPVPTIVSTTQTSLTTMFVDGLHGQELIDAGHGFEVMTALGHLRSRCVV